MKIARIALGTAQLGLNYGVTNSVGRVGLMETRCILRLCADRGIDTLDTAHAYGDSESIIGQCAPPGAHFRIVTKTPKFTALDGAAAVELLKSTFRTSLFRLRRGKIYALLVHNAADLLGPAGTAIWSAMQQFKSEGLVEKIGASVYEAGEIDRLLASRTVDLIQLPLSPLDRRLLDSGHIDALASAGIEIHARSLFLQGLLLADPCTIPEQLAPIASVVAELDRLCAKAGLSRLQAILAFASRQDAISRFVVGVTNAYELQGIILAAERAELVKDFQVPQFFGIDPGLLNPARWSELLGQICSSSTN